MNRENTAISRLRLIVICITAVAFIVGCGTKKSIKNQKDELSAFEPKRIIDIQTLQDQKSFTIQIKGDRLLTYTSVKQPFPFGVALYFPETLLGNVKTTHTPESDIIGSITASELDGKKPRSRIVISLKNDAPYDITRKGENLVVRFLKPGTERIAGPEASRMKSVTASELSDRVKITIEADGVINDFESFTLENPPRIVFDMFNITSPYLSSAEKTVPVGSKWVKQIRHFGHADKVRLVVDTTNRYLSEYSAAPAKSGLAIIIGGGATPPIGKIAVAREKLAPVPELTKTDNKVYKPTYSTPSTYSAPSAYSAPKTYSNTPNQYSGKKVALDFYESDIKSVLRVLQEVSGQNFAIDKNVSGKVTLSLEKPVPWVQVLDLALKMNRLGKIQEGNVLRIATLETLQNEGKLGKKGSSAIYKSKGHSYGPVVTEYIPINYADAENDIAPHLEKIITEGTGSLSVDKRTSTIIITDSYEKIRQAKAIVAKLDKVTPQVVIEARIVEASTNFSKEIGTQWGTGIGVQSPDLLSVDGLTSDIENQLTERVGVAGSERGYNNFGGTYGYNAAVNLPLSNPNVASIGFNFVKILGTPLLLNAKLMAMETKGQGKIISAPKVVTLDNKKAIIKQGVSYPYNKFDEAGNTTTEFIDIDLVLEVTPHVTPDNRIAMNINIEKNDFGAIINNVPSFTTKEAKTELLVNNGDTVVIGGIIKTRKTSSESGVPWISQIPLVGWLFKSKNKTNEKEELLIFITPRIVKLEESKIY